LMMSIDKNTDSIAQINKKMDEQKQFFIDKIKSNSTV